MTSKDEIRKLIKDTVKESVAENLGDYKIPKEQHYQDHEWIRDVQSWVDGKIKWIDGMQDNFWKSLIFAAVTGTVGLVLLGISVWIKLQK